MTVHTKSYICYCIEGPLLGGIFGQFLGWRSNFYFLAIVGGLLFLMVLFFLPETLRRKRLSETDLADQEIAAKRESTLKRAFAPFKPMIGLLSYPNVLIITIYNSVIFGSLYFMVRNTLHDCICPLSKCGLNNKSKSVVEPHHYPNLHRTIPLQ